MKATRALTPPLTFAKHGAYNDADMLEIGNPGLTFDEARAHFSAWVVIMSTLLVGTDIVSRLDNAALSILSNHGRRAR